MGRCFGQVIRPYEKFLELEFQFRLVERIIIVTSVIFLDMMLQLMEIAPISAAAIYKITAQFWAVRIKLRRPALVIVSTTQLTGHSFASNIRYLPRKSKQRWLHDHPPSEAQ